MTGPTREKVKQMIVALPFALDATLPKDAEDEIRSVFTGYLALLDEIERLQNSRTTFIERRGEPLSYPLEGET